MATLTEDELRAMFRTMHGTNGQDGSMALTPADMAAFSDLGCDLSVAFDENFKKEYPILSMLTFENPTGDDGAVDKIEALMADGADFAAEIQRGIYTFSEKTALFVAVHKNWPKTCRWLLDFNKNHGHPAWPYLQNAHGCTALDYASPAADIGWASVGSQTQVAQAIGAARVLVEEFLIDPRVPNNCGEITFDRARQNGHERLADLLLAACDARAPETLAFNQAPVSLK